MNKKAVVAFVIAINTVLASCTVRDYKGGNIHIIDNDTDLSVAEEVLKSKPKEIVNESPTITMPENEEVGEKIEDIVIEIKEEIEPIIVIDEPEEIEEVVEEIVEEEPIIETKYELRYATLKYDTGIYMTDEFTDEVDFIEKYQKVLVVKNDSINSIIIKSDGITGYVKTDCLQMLPETYVEIDISDQTLFLYKDGELLLNTSVVTGKNTTPTNYGCFNIYYKATKTYLTGPTWKSWVEYWMPFDGEIGLHDANWRNEFGGTIYEYYGSHGCVNMPPSVAPTVYENVELGTVVLVHK